MSIFTQINLLRQNSRPGKGTSSSSSSYVFICVTTTPFLSTDDQWSDHDTRVTTVNVAFRGLLKQFKDRGELRVFYFCCHWSRVASRPIILAYISDILITVLTALSLEFQGVCFLLLLIPLCTNTLSMAVVYPCWNNRTIHTGKFNILHELLTVKRISRFHQR